MHLVFILYVCISLLAGFPFHDYAITCSHTILLKYLMSLFSFRLLETQHRMAIIAEMIHTASLVHDDVIDTSDTRRGKASVNVLWGQKKVIYFFPSVY